jgi:large subunit ribosomal protein L3
MRRVGALGVKIGMTTLWDSWGHIVPATVIQLDRTQIVQIKKPVRNNTFYQVQIGIG